MLQINRKFLLGIISLNTLSILSIFISLIYTIFFKEFSLEIIQSNQIELIPEYLTQLIFIANLIYLNFVFNKLFNIDIKFITILLSIYSAFTFLYYLFPYFFVNLLFMSTQSSFFGTILSAISLLRFVLILLLIIKTRKSAIEEYNYILKPYSLLLIIGYILIPLLTILFVFASRSSFNDNDIALETYINLTFIFISSFAVYLAFNYFLYFGILKKIEKSPIESL